MYPKAHAIDAIAIALLEKRGEKGRAVQCSPLIMRAHVRSVGVPRDVDAVDIVILSIIMDGAWLRRHHCGNYNHKYFNEMKLATKTHIVSLMDLQYY